MDTAYSNYETILISLISGMTNLSGIPIIKLFYMKGYMFHFYLSLLTFLSSFMYHSTEYIDFEIFMSTDKWHYLDNISSITLMNCLFIHYMNYDNYVDSLNINYFSLVFILIFQTKAPFELINTFIPLSFFFLLMLYYITLYGIKNINYTPIKNGLVLMTLGLICFFKGLDRKTDYLRFVHSIWHVFAGWGGFYLWQGRDNTDDQLGYLSILKLPLNSEINYLGKDSQILYLNSKNN